MLAFCVLPFLKASASEDELLRTEAAKQDQEYLAKELGVQLLHAEKKQAELMTQMKALRKKNQVRLPVICLCFPLPSVPHVSSSESALQEMDGAVASTTSELHEALLQKQVFVFVLWHGFV